MRRILILASCLCAMAIALYSCSMRATVLTDGEGNVVKVSSLRVESSLSRVAVAMLAAGGQFALELRWTRCVPAGRGETVGG